VTPTRHLWGIDLGGTKIEGAIMDPANPGKTLCRLRVPTGADQGYDHVLGGIAGLVDELAQATRLPRPDRIGIGTPGAVEPSAGLIKNSNTTCLNGKPLRLDLEDRLGCGVVTENDANCFALAESRFGAGQGATTVMGLILGTGVGGGILLDGKIHAGRHGIAGEWGHNPMRGEDYPCYCGRRGCIETVIAGPSLERHYRELGGERIRLPAICRRAEKGEPIAIETLERLRSKFAEAIGAVINILDPDVIVIGGGVGNIPILYEDKTYAMVSHHVFNAELRTRILPPQLGDSAGVFGAALLSM
jgi:fructokinase